jgi:hypothetical protein
MTHTGTLELVAAANDERNLRLTAEFCLGRLAGGFRSVISEVIESYTRGLVEGLASMAERHWQAHQRLENRNQATEHP